MFRCPELIYCFVALCTLLRVAETGNKCLTELEEVIPKRVVQDEGRSVDITFELTRRTSQRLVTRVMKIFLVEVLGYPGISLIEKDDKFDGLEVFERLSIDANIDDESIIPETMVNMEVWVSGQIDMTSLPEQWHVKECGTVGPGGYFGWFVPRELWYSNMSETWRTFSNGDSAAQFNVDEDILSLIKSHTLKPGLKNERYCSEIYCEEGIYIPERCQNSNSCAMLLAGEPDVTNFVKNHIDEFELYVQVAWVGKALKHLTQHITRIYKTKNTGKSLAILHWTPSAVIPNDRDFVSIAFPRCRKSNQPQCKYGDRKMVKAAWSMLESIATIAYKAIRKTYFTGEMYEDLLFRYNNRDVSTTTEDTVACDWLRNNSEHVLRYWKPQIEDKKILNIGGIFPMSGDKYVDRSIVVAADMATKAINRNNSVLRDYELKLSASDGQCTSDMVMKSFIDYYIHSQKEPLIGILGPACSETVEPLIGVSKQYSTMVISYSAEGSSFNDRKKYPYFFRTIGENIHYKDVYLSLLEQMKWRRVAALTEDGQKYTEYISHMQYYLEQNGITFVDNAKYPRQREDDLIFRYLENLKKKRARIIIADVDDDVARQVMCDAYKLKMTAYEGYVWFLPLWLLPGWWDTDTYNTKKGESVSCTTAEMNIAINGYLGISHAYYAPDEALMQENSTVREWRNRYESECQYQNQPPSQYGGYAYDAIWTYAYAMDKLLSENGSYIFALQTTQTADRLTDIINRTDFRGVSGRIKFLNGASRISSVEIIQHINNETKKIGIFHPNVSEINNEIIGGHLDFNMSAIVWLTSDGQIPNDGFEAELKCVFAGLAELLDVTCEVSIIIVNIIGFGCLGILLIVGFVIIKKKYDAKVRLHEKYMKSLGLDLIQIDTSGLDKWEIPRECVVINRKLGEGAFGTVYGGEAFFTEKGWLAVAVKTLKVGSSTEEKLDFLSEVEVMKRFEHKNIIKLLGVCIKCEPVYTVMEFMLYGDMKTYLLARRHLVNDRNYEDYDEISSKKLTTMALDIARALSYLAQLKYVHRDIASRNCLINAQRVVKLGDFGMTRPMYENDYYKFNRKGMLPVRWMAPESLGLGIFTPASDVWSYGVLLYEIITFGSFPFQGLSNNEVLEHVKTGNTITIPSGIKPALENLMRSCWTIEHKLRPKAPEIVDFLATNPRILSPCLDVPLASVQIEHNGDIDIQLPEKFRKFSISLLKSNGDQPAGSKLTNRNNLSEIPLMEETELCPNNQRCRGFITASKLTYESEPSASGTADTSTPLLQTESIIQNCDNNGIVSKYVELERNIDNGSKDDNELLARYVNMQPGIIPTAGIEFTDNVPIRNRRILPNDRINLNQEEDSTTNRLDRISLL